MLLLAYSQPIAAPSYSLRICLMRVIASSTACSTPRRYATSQDRLLRREYGVRLIRSGRSEQDDPSINDHARGRLARRTATSRFSRRTFQNHAQRLLLIWEQRKEKQPHISTATRFEIHGQCIRLHGIDAPEAAQTSATGANSNGPADSGRLSPWLITSVTAHRKVPATSLGVAEKASYVFPERRCTSSVRPFSAGLVRQALGGADAIEIHGNF
jgi:hypothetical protein